MKKFIYALCLLLPVQAYALEGSARGSYDKINNCVLNHDLSGCRSDITASSTPIYDRFTSYGLDKCLPQDAVFVSETPDPLGHIIRASTMQNGKQRTLRLIFVNEEDRWKLDIPQSLHLSMGDNWEKQLDSIEQLYLLLKQQLGPQANCEMLRGLAHPSGNASH